MKDVLPMIRFNLLYIPRVLREDVKTWINGVLRWKNMPDEEVAYLEKIEGQMIVLKNDFLTDLKIKGTIVLSWSKWNFSKKKKKTLS